MINAIVCTNAPLTDQLDYLRPDPSSVGLATPCDVGAVESGSVLSDSFAGGFARPRSTSKRETVIGSPTFV